MLIAVGARARMNAQLVVMVRPRGATTEVIPPRRPAHRDQNCVKNAQDSVGIQFVLLPESLAMFVCPPLNVHALVGNSALHPWKS